MKNNNLYVLFTIILTGCFVLVSCDKARPIKNCETYAEMDDPAMDSISDWTTLNGLRASFASIDVRYPKSVLPTIETHTEHKIVGWKGEKVSAQILLWTSEEIKQVVFEFSDFKSDKHTLPGSIAQARFVRYVMTDEFGRGCGKREPENFAASLSPDMLDNVDCFDLEANKVRPVWLSINIPKESTAGIYNSIIKMHVIGADTREFNLEVEVINQTLPMPSEWKFHLDQWQHPSAVARVQNLELWSDAHFEALKPLMKMLADAGQKVITATMNKEPWNNQAYDPYADMIVWTKNADGTWEYDYTVFDKWVNLMLDLGVNKMINCYSIVPWNNEIHYKDATSGEFVNVKADPGTKIFEEMWGNFLPDFIKHLTKKGWIDIANIAMDERDPKSMDATLNLLKEVAPELGISLADNHKSYRRYPYIKDISVSALDRVPSEDITARRQLGLNTTYYVCCSDAFPNQFTFSDPAESAYIGWYAMAANFDGFLRWAYNSWVENPLLDSRFRTWPAGDTYIVYPDARSSIRFERLVEGIQDFEKIRIIKQQLQDKGTESALASLEELNSAIAKLEKGERTATWNADLNAAKTLLNRISKE